MRTKKYRFDDMKVYFDKSQLFIDIYFTNIENKTKIKISKIMEGFEIEWSAIEMILSYRKNIVSLSYMDNLISRFAKKWGD